MVVKRSISVRGCVLPEWKHIKRDGLFKNGGEELKIFYLQTAADPESRICVQVVY
jgi:hypothetical protein